MLHLIWCCRVSGLKITPCQCRLLHSFFWERHIALRYVKSHHIALQANKQTNERTNKHTLHNVTLHCSTLHHITLNYITLNYVTLQKVRYITLRCVTFHSMPFQSIPTHAYILVVGPSKVTFTTRTLIFLVCSPFQPSIATLTGRRPHRTYNNI